MANRDLVILGSFYTRRGRRCAGMRRKNFKFEKRRLAGVVEDTRTCRICSRSSANASATDAIQNCLNRFRRACSSWARLLDPSGGRKGGASASGGEGEGDRRRSRFLAGSESVRCCIAAEEDAGCVTGASILSSSSPSSESDDEDEDEDNGDGNDLVACGFIRGASLV
jgi:hypothetical protein